MFSLETLVDVYTSTNKTIALMLNILIIDMKNSLLKQPKYQMQTEEKRQSQII